MAFLSPQYQQPENSTVWSLSPCMLTLYYQSFPAGQIMQFSQLWPLTSLEYDERNNSGGRKVNTRRTEQRAAAYITMIDPTLSSADFYWTVLHIYYYPTIYAGQKRRLIQTCVWLHTLQRPSERPATLPAALHSWCISSTITFFQHQEQSDHFRCTMLSEGMLHHCYRTGVHASHSLFIFSLSCTMQETVHMIMFYMFLLFTHERKIFIYLIIFSILKCASCSSSCMFMSVVAANYKRNRDVPASFIHS